MGQPIRHQPLTGEFDRSLKTVPREGFRPSGSHFIPPQAFMPGHPKMEDAGEFLGYCSKQLNMLTQKPPGNESIAGAIGQDAKQHAE